MKLDPAAANVSFWLKSLSPDQIHDEGWIEINRRFHGIARAARTYINENYQDDVEKQAAFDGLTMALLTVAHFEDINLLHQLFIQESLDIKFQSNRQIEADK